MAFNQIIILPIRIAQTLFALIILCVLAYSAHNWSYHTFTPSQISFNIFASVWTLLALVYLVLAPISFQQYSHKYAILAVESVTMIFWFAGFVALATFLDVWGFGGSKWGPYQAAVAGCIFGAFEWMLFCLTTFMAAHYVWTSKGESKHDPNIEVQHV
jgi:hypothetical protein